MQEAVYVSLEFTPNPNTLKYSVNRTLLSKGALNILTLNDAELKSPLALLLLKVPGVAAVMIGRDFVTVTKTEEGDWDVVHKNASQIIEEFLTVNKDAVSPAYLAELENNPNAGSANEIEKKIIEILDAEIRPAVAMDGGDITFDRFEAGVVYLYMQGSCSGCPSSTMTLKMGIETRLKEQIPEVLEVVAV